MEINDVTKRESFSRVLVYDSAQLSAEWIVEKPTINGVLSPLADFGNVTFTDCSATLSNRTGTISDFSNIQFTMYNDDNVQLTDVSALNAEGSSFTVSYAESSSAAVENNGSTYAFSASWLIGDAGKKILSLPHK